MSLTFEETPNRAALEAFLRQDAELHIYELGDLDPFFWPHTRWWLGWDDQEQPRAVVMIYELPKLPCVLALGREGDPWPGDLLDAALDRLPTRFYAHLQPGLAERLGDRCQLEPPAPHWKMAWRNPSLGESADVGDVVPLSSADLGALRSLYTRAYPGNWFDPRMLETGMYSGVWEGNRLVSVAGVHVFAPEVGAAALGNITTDPAQRGRGLARRTTASLCLRLREAGVETIGLNVAQKNSAAIACYQRLGFEVIAPYDEVMVTRA